MSRPGGRVAILGGGMAGLSAAWRLSEPGWRDRFDSITVYQRGWRLGGKAASSRGQNGRIEEHGLHVWLGSYENAFTMLRQCYAELDRATTDPQAPIRSWEQAMIPSDSLALADRRQHDWSVWLGGFARNDELPGEPDANVPELTVVGFLRRALQLILDFADSLGKAPTSVLVLSTSPDPHADVGAIEALRRAVTATLAAMSDPSQRAQSASLDAVLNAIHVGLDDRHPDRKRVWLLLSLVTATVRGLIFDNLVTNPLGFRAINDEDFGDWILRHGAHPDVLEFPLVRGLYDMVFGYRDGDRSQPAFGAGLAVLWTGNMLFGYKGALFWKMTAGMGDVVIAPLYQVLRRRGVRFEFFHRLDALHLDPTHRSIEAITMGRQLRLADGVDQYAPLVEVSGLPAFPNAPVAAQIDPHTDIGCLESHFGKRDDAETRLLRSGIDFDHVVLAVSLGMVEIVAGELIADSAEWRDMTAHVRTVATQAFQIWLRPDEESLGCKRPGATVSAYLPPFDTWSSM
ncbi:NAD(P)-binding protein, partial [Mycobacterium sp.]|uniref:NAD(P)-binding protein n=1 Tax=Mycobacterium sp. TaxID=1785 RepID=UPI003C7955CA